MSMYVRVKRKKTTVFLHVEPTDTILEVKQKLQEHLGEPPQKQQLYKNQNLLEDAKKLAELHIENDDILALTFQLEDGTYEPIDITPYEGAEHPAAS